MKQKYNLIIKNRRSDNVFQVYFKVNKIIQMTHKD